MPQKYVGQVNLAGESWCLILLLLVLIIWWLLGLPGLAQLLEVGGICGTTEGSAPTLKLMASSQAFNAAVIGNLGCHPIPYLVELCLLSLNNGSGQISDGGVSLSRPSWARGLCTRRTGPSGLLSHLQCNNSLNDLLVEELLGPWCQSPGMLSTPSAMLGGGCLQSPVEQCGGYWN